MNQNLNKSNHNYGNDNDNNNNSESDLDVLEVSERSAADNVPNTVQLHNETSSGLGGQAEVAKKVMCFELKYLSLFVLICLSLLKLVKTC